MDANGRSAFALGDLSGWVDVLGIELHVQVTMADGNTYRWEGDLPSETNDGLGALIQTRKKKCLCKNTSEQRDCTSDDCDNQRACWTGTENSTCGWFPVTVKQPQNPPQGGGISGKADSILLLGGIGLVTFCVPVRRRLMRRVCTQR